MDLLFHLLLFVIAAVANLLSALAGGGAGLLQLPALILLGLPFPVALATHKVASVALGLGATLRHTREHTLEWRFALFLLGAGLPGVVAGASLVLTLPERMAEISLGILIAALGIYSRASPRLGLEHAPRRRNRRGYLIGALVLAGLGVINGSLTAGSGLFVTIWLVRWFGLDYTRAVAYTLVLVGVFWNGTGALTLGLMGDIKWTWLPALIAGSLLGGYLGAHLAIVRGNHLIKGVFEVITILVGLRLIIG